jgi:hypothetical protein
VLCTHGMWNLDILDGIFWISHSYLLPTLEADPCRDSNQRRLRFCNWLGLTMRAPGVLKIWHLSYCLVGLYRREGNSIRMLCVRSLGKFLVSEEEGGKGSSPTNRRIWYSICSWLFVIFCHIESWVTSKFSNILNKLSSWLIYFCFQIIAFKVIWLKIIYINLHIMFLWLADFVREFYIFGL